MPGPENCGGIDMLFIISYCINYIRLNGKEERRNERRGNLVCAVRLATVIGFIAPSPPFLAPQYSSRPRIRGDRR